MLSLLKRSVGRSPIGLDVGHAGVRAVQTVRAGRLSTVIGAVNRRRQQDLSDDSRHADDEAQLVERCVSGGEFVGRRAATVLHDPDVTYLPLDLPSAVATGDEAELSQVIQWEMGRQLDRPLDDVEIRHWTLPVTSAPAPTAMGTAVDLGAVERRCKLCDDAGLSCQAVDAGAAALTRFGMLLERWSPTQVWGILDIGSERSSIVVCYDGVPVLVRHAGPGGRSWTDRVAETLGVSVTTAEIQKCEHGISDVTAASASASRSDLTSILLGALRPELRAIATEVKRSFDYVLSCYPSSVTGDLVLVGGGACLGHLPEFLTDALGIPVRLASEYLSGEHCRVRYISGKQNPLEPLACAIGMACEE